MTGGNHTPLLINYWTFGLGVPAIGFAVSFLGAFLGLRCASRAHACRGLAKTTWLLLGGVSIGALGIWAMDFIALLGFTIRGSTIRYDLPGTALSLLIAVAFMCGCVLAAGFGRARSGWLLTGGLVTGISVAVMHYLAMSALRMPAQIAYAPGPMIGSVVIAIGAATAAMWAVAAVRALWHAVFTAVAVSVAITVMHYVAMDAVRLYQVPGPAAAQAGGGATVQALLLPLIIGITVLIFLVGAVIALSPTADAIRYDESLLDDIKRHADSSLAATPLPVGHTGSRPALPRSSPPWTFAELRPPSPSPAITGRGRTVLKP
jgi:NO-binding membrane sensor protein with MHYT domain